MLGRLPHLPSLRLPNSADAEIANETMQACDVLAHADLPFHRLSHGVRARVMLARALVQQPKLLLADEPLGGLDIAHQLQLMELFRRKAKDGMGVLAVMHDLALAARYCDSVIVLSQGRIAASGQPESVLTQQNLQTFFHVEAALRSVENIPTLVAHRALSDS